MTKNNLILKHEIFVIFIIYCCSSLAMAKSYKNTGLLNSNNNLWTDWILVRSSQNKNIIPNDITNEYPVATYNNNNINLNNKINQNNNNINQNTNEDTYSGIATYLNPSVLNPSVEVYAISSSNLMNRNLNLISNNSLQNEIKDVGNTSKFPIMNWFLERIKSFFQIIEQNNINDSSISKYLLDLNTNDNTKRSFNEARKKIGKKYKKMLLPLLLAYKLKFFTLVPVLIGGLILLVGTTGAAGFFFALFAAVMSLKPHDH